MMEIKRLMLIQLFILRFFSLSENEAALVTKNPTSLEHENPITVNKAQTKFQKRGGKQSLRIL